MKTHILPTQDDLRGDIDPLLRLLAERVMDFRARHLHEGTDYHNSITNGQKPLALVSQCVDGRQPVHTIMGLPLGRLIAQSSIAGFLHDYPDSAAAWATVLFAVKNLGAPAIIKLGHTGCGGAEKLIDLCQGKEAAEIDNATDLDPTLDWLKTALPLTRDVLNRHPNLPREELAFALEEELVRDGVRKLENFLDMMVRQGHLTQDQRPATVGLLFDMHKAKLHHLQPTGEFKLLSETKKSSPPRKAEQSPPRSYGEDAKT